MAEAIIKPIENNIDKQKTYSYQMARYKTAMQKEFYLEALMIVYGTLEDRLRSILYHSGALANRRSTKINAKRTKEYIKKIVAENKDGDETDNIGITNITGKIKIVRKILKFASKEDEDIVNNRYLSALKNQYMKVDMDALTECLDSIEKWCKYRNEVIHALMNKNIESLYSGLSEQAAKGMELARFLDSQERIMKKGNVIRKAANLPIQ